MPCALDADFAAGSAQFEIDSILLSRVAAAAAMTAVFDVNALGFRLAAERGRLTSMATEAALLCSSRRHRNAMKR